MALGIPDNSETDIAFIPIPLFENKSIKKSSLDSIKGLGPKKKKDLMKYFKSIKLIKSASLNDLCMVPGISIKLAREIKIFYES